MIQAVVELGLPVWRAAEKLSLSRRQIERLAVRYRVDGPVGLGLRKRGQTVRRIMTDAGFWVPRRLRPPTVHQPRNRRACLRELVQIDGSDHAWFEDRAPACTLLVFVDDATGQLMQLLFAPTESTLAYFTATRACIERYGKPLAFYSDKAGIFRANRQQTPEGRGYTQFGRALFELNIDILCANSSQAAGRVERMNGTLKDRLVTELRLRGISSMADANAYAKIMRTCFRGGDEEHEIPERNAWRAVAKCDSYLAQP